MIPEEKYIFRRFDIQRGKWSGKIFHYHDSWCNKPKFTVKFDGAYEVTPKTATTHSTSSFACKFNFDNVMFTSSSEDVVKEVINYLLAKCPLALSLKADTKLNMKELVDKDIKLESDAVHKKHCRYYLGLHTYSHKKIRMVKDSTRLKYQTLYFGEIPKFETKHTRHKVPNSFQYGLARVDRPWCKICEQAAQSDKAPILPIPEEKNNFVNKWVTETCQASDDRTYETYYYEFQPIPLGKEVGSFNIYKAFFLDPDCKKLKFDFKVGGIYYDNLPYQVVPDVRKMKMRYTWMSMTAYDQATLKLMKNSVSCGKPEEWKYGVEQNVTSTHGCSSVLPAKLPFVSDVIVRSDKINNKRELYLEEYEPGMYFKNSLVTCDSVTKNLIMKKTTLKPTAVPKVTLPTKREEIENEIQTQIDRRLREELEDTSSAAVELRLFSLLLHFLPLTCVLYFYL